MDWDTLIFDLQTEMRMRLESCAYLDDIVILQDNHGLTESDVEQVLNVFMPESGKASGACVIVMKPQGMKSDSDSPLFDITARINVQILTLPLVNDSTSGGGSGKQAETIKAWVMTELHDYFSGALRLTLRMAEKPWSPVDDAADGVVSYLVHFETTTAFGSRARVATPGITVSGGEATLTCGTDGAAIYYTTDGSYPGAANAAATLYSAPFPVADGDVIRAGATLADTIPSSTLYAEIKAVVLDIGDGSLAGIGDGGVIGTGEVDVAL